MSNAKKAPEIAPHECSILIVDDSPDTIEVIRRNLTARGYPVSSVSSAEAAAEHLAHHPVDLVLTDYKMPRVTGLDLIRHVRANHPLTEIVMITGYASVEGAVQAVKAGAEAYLAKPFTADELFQVVEATQRKIAARRQTHVGEGDEYTLQFGLIGRSPAMRRLYATIKKAAASTATVLVTGETGTGKELVARAIHYSGPRANAPFVPVNCGGIPESLLERELFGHLKGSFTGATETRAGFFQTAQGGTLLLDEIAETTPQMQVKLLRALQEREICMVGDTKPFPVDVRVIAATNRNLAERVRSGAFREDLYYRLAVLLVDVPPLRDREDDVPLLTHHFAARFAASMDREPPQFSEEVLATLQSYAWPGNVRELENLVHRLVVMAEGEEITAADLPPHMRFAVSPRGEWRRTLADVERAHIENVLAQVGGNKSQAARILGVTRKTLREKLKKMSESAPGHAGSR